jgi:hypothetical protein
MYVLRRMYSISRIIPNNPTFVSLGIGFTCFSKFELDDARGVKIWSET